MPKGQTNNPKGRPKGTPNRITGQLRDAITEFIEGNFNEVVLYWRKLEPKDKLNFYRDLLQYVVPKLASTEIKTNEKFSLADYVRELAEKEKVDRKGLNTK